MASLRWSAPSRADDPAWVELLAAIEEADDRGETYELDDLGDEWQSVWAHPDTDAQHVWDGPELVGFGWLKAMPGQRKHHRVAFWGGVRPSHRRRGIGTALFEWSVQRGTEIAQQLDASLPVEMDLDADDRQRDLVAVAADAGFAPVRTFLELARPVTLPVTPTAAPPGLELVPWSPDLDEAARLAHTEAFQDHWGSEPRSAEEWAQWYTGHRSFRPDLSVLALDPASGQVAALVLTAAYPQDWERLPPEAWINTVGTRRAWRGKGVARWLMDDVHQRIAAADDGLERAILGVDSENPTGALGLYRSLGYEDVRSVLSLARTLR
jgi:ribosomal protein S18 acetylase RimI-like enzyme